MAKQQQYLEISNQIENEVDTAVPPQMDMDEYLEMLKDPVRFVGFYWPEIKLYNKQVEILYSIRDNDETIVPAGNQLGKDFIAGLAALWFFCSRSPARVVTSSVDFPQLEGVLWGEIRRFIQDAEYPLPLHIRHLHLRQKFLAEDGQTVLEPRSEMLGRVVAKGEGLLGRHLERGPDGEPSTLVIFDEASGMRDNTYTSVDTWAHRKLVIGNCFPCANFFFHGVKGGDLPNPRKPGRFYRKVIKIKAIDSPNVIAKENVLPGVIDYDTYLKRLTTWPAMMKSIGLDAEFHQDENSLLFPPDWLVKCDEFARELLNRGKERVGRRAMGVDTAEGGDNSVWTIVDELGLITQVSKKTSNTAECVNFTIHMIKRYKLNPEDVWFDRGGGGKQHVDQLRERGYKCNSVGFGEAATGSKRRRRSTTQKLLDAETVYTYRNKRAELYGAFRFNWLDPCLGKPYALPDSHNELLRQLCLFPMQFDSEGRLYLPPKRRKATNTHEITLMDLMGSSPDEADSFMLANYGYMKGYSKRRLKAFSM